MPHPERKTKVWASLRRTARNKGKCPAVWGEGTKQSWEAGNSLSHKDNYYEKGCEEAFTGETASCRIVPFLMSQRVWKKTQTFNGRKAGGKECNWSYSSHFYAQVMRFLHHTTLLTVLKWVTASLHPRARKGTRATLLSWTTPFEWVFLIAETLSSRIVTVQLHNTAKGILRSCPGHPQVAASHTDLLCDVQLRTVSIPQGVVFRVWQWPPGRGRRRIRKVLPPLSSGSQLGAGAWSQQGGKELFQAKLWHVKSGLPKKEENTFLLRSGTGLHPTLSQILWNVCTSRTARQGNSQKHWPQGHIYDSLRTGIKMQSLCVPGDPFLPNLNPGPSHGQNWQQAAWMVLAAHWQAAETAAWGSAEHQDLSGGRTFSTRVPGELLTHHRPPWWWMQEAFSRTERESSVATFLSTRKDYYPFLCLTRSVSRLRCISSPIWLPVSPDLFPAAGHWHLATQQLLSRCPKVVALLQTPPDAFTTAYSPTPVKRKDSQQLSENFFSCYIASNTKFQNAS